LSGDCRFGKFDIRIYLDFRIDRIYPSAMTTPPPITASPADPASPGRGAGCAYDGEGRAPDPTDRAMRMLDRLAVIGMEMTELLYRQVQDEDAARGAAPPAAEAAEPAAAPDKTIHQRVAETPAKRDYDRLTRSVRLTLALLVKFHNDRLEREQKAAAGIQAVEEQRKPRLRKQLERVAREAIRRQTDPRDREHLRLTLYERLEEDDIERDLLDRPFGELIRRICRDIGIEPDWEFWGEDYWAVEEIRLKPAGSPYAGGPLPKPDLAAGLHPYPQPTRPEPPSG